MSHNVCNIYENIAEWFDENRWKTLVEKPYLDALLEHVPAGGHVLDIGCGTGEPIARYVIEQGFSVTGVDGAAKMIKLSRARFPEQEWIFTDMRTLELKRNFDALIAWDSFFHLPQEDQRRMFPIFRAHAKPGARLLFTSGPEEGEVFGEMEGHQMYHASLSTEEYHLLLKAHDFKVLQHKVKDEACGDRTVWLVEFLG